MTDFINFGKTIRRTPQVIITESTQDIVEAELGESLGDIVETKDENEVVATLNETNKVVAKKTKRGIKVKQALKG